MNMQKKGQGLPLNVIIIAILGVLVLIILAALVTSGALNFAGNVQGCVSNAGQCFDNGSYECKRVNAFTKEHIDPAITTRHDPSCGDNKNINHCCPAGHEPVRRWVLD